VPRRPLGESHDGELRIHPERGGKDAPVHHEEALGVVRLELLVEDAARRIAAGAAAPQRMKSGQFEHRRREPRGAQGEISTRCAAFRIRRSARTPRARPRRRRCARESPRRGAASRSPGLPSRHVRVLLHHARHPRSHEGQGEGAELRRSEDSFEENSLAVEIVDAQALRHALPAAAPRRGSVREASAARGDARIRRRGPSAVSIALCSRPSSLAASAAKWR